MLVHLPGDAVCVVASLLDYENLQALRATSRSLFLDCQLRDARASTLTLPPTNHNRAEKLIQGLLTNDPQRMAQFKWIQVATVWHLELLIKFGVGENIQISTIRAKDTETTEQICAALTRLHSLRRLDVSLSRLRNGPLIGHMTQLQELHVGEPGLRDLSFLASLTRLEILSVSGTDALDINGVEHLVHLRELSIKQGFTPLSPVISVPPLRRLTNLQTLNLRSCRIESTADLLEAARSIKTLKGSDVTPRIHSGIAGTSLSDRSNPDVVEHARRLTQLESVEWGNFLQVTRATCELELELLTPWMPSLRSIESFFTGDFQALEALQSLQEIKLRVHRREDFQILVKLPQLRHVSLQRHVDQDEDDYDCGFTEALNDVLVQLPKLRRLSLDGDFEKDLPPPTAKLHQLEHLHLAYDTPKILSYDWLKDFQSLRSLPLSTETTPSNALAISQLTSLQELALDFVTFKCDGDSSFNFLSPLVKLSKLRIRSNHLHDLEFLRGMKRLTHLTIDFRCSEIEMENVDALSGLTQLRVVDIGHTNIDDVSVLLELPELRTARIPFGADWELLAQSDHPKLLHLIKRGRNCLCSEQPARHPARKNV